MNAVNEQLNDLVENGTIKSFKIVNLNSNGDVGESEFRNTEQLTLTFNDGSELVLGTFCSGSSENTCFVGPYNE